MHNLLQQENFQKINLRDQLKTIKYSRKSDCQEVKFLSVRVCEDQIDQSKPAILEKFPKG